MFKLITWDHGSDAWTRSSVSSLKSLAVTKRDYDTKYYLHFYWFAVTSVTPELILLNFKIKPHSITANTL